VAEDQEPGFRQDVTGMLNDGSRNLNEAQMPTLDLRAARRLPQLRVLQNFPMDLSRN
jgi:hypothetical protein